MMTYYCYFARCATPCTIAHQSVQRPAPVRVSCPVHRRQQYFSKLFHREMNMALTEYIRSVRLKKAKQLLKSSSLQLEDIAHLVGYDNANYFIRIF
ncbi:MAG: helix-turn-helix transcriptional regulator [Treponema sp.]|nr:helix-turn-helix transcriptional regulator [Treponema sp.]